MVTDTTSIMPYTLVMCLGVWVWGGWGGVGRYNINYALYICVWTGIDLCCEALKGVCVYIYIHTHAHTPRSFALSLSLVCSLSLSLSLSLSRARALCLSRMACVTFVTNPSLSPFKSLTNSRPLSKSLSLSLSASKLSHGCPRRGGGRV
jgi:hypothetical protein